MSEDRYPVPRPIAATTERFYNNPPTSNLPPRFQSNQSGNGNLCSSKDNYRTHRLKAKERKLQKNQTLISHKTSSQPVS